MNMFFDSVNFGKDILKLKEQFKKIDDDLQMLESSISDMNSTLKSPTINNFKSVTKNLNQNHEILLDHFTNIEKYLENVKSNYDM